MSSKSRVFSFGLGVLIILGLLICAQPALSDWDIGDPARWIQLPDETYGFDVAATLKLADDFQSIGSGPITDIHIWGSFLSNNVYNPTFILELWSNVPVGDPTNSVPYSHPGNSSLWSKTFEPGQYSSRTWTSGVSETFFDPSIGVAGTDNTIYQFNFLIDPQDAFQQQAGTIYWLSVQANVGSESGQVAGWKTHEPVYNLLAMKYEPTMDAAVWWNGSTWIQLNYGNTGAYQNTLMDQAFVINTPIPGSLLLLGSGLLGLEALGWLRKKKA